MTARITLGSGPDAVEVEDGASVSLIGGSVTATRDATICMFGDVAAVCFWSTWHNGRSISSVHLPDGRLDGWDDLSVDLDALRRERAPKPVTVGGWTNRLPDGSAPAHLYSARPDKDFYWTHRPGNTPEKQAAFDAAVEAWLAEVFRSGRQSGTPTDGLVDAARALGYGRR